MNGCAYKRKKMFYVNTSDSVKGKRVRNIQHVAYFSKSGGSIEVLMPRSAKAHSSSLDHVTKEICQNLREQY